jgi:excisionase family DNA binding protein
MERTMKDGAPSFGLVSLREAAILLHMSVPSLRRWIREGRLGCVRCGRAVRIEREELARFVARNRQAARES